MIWNVLYLFGIYKHQQLTRYIKHLAESTDFNGGTFNKLFNGLIGNRFEMPNVSYTRSFTIQIKNLSISLIIPQPILNILKLPNFKKQRIRRNILRFLGNELVNFFYISG